MFSSFFDMYLFFGYINFRGDYFGVQEEKKKEKIKKEG